MSWAGDNDIVNLNSNYIAIIYIDVYGVFIEGLRDGCLLERLYRYVLFEVWVDCMTAGAPWAKTKKVNAIAIFGILQPQQFGQGRRLK